MQRTVTWLKANAHWLAEAKPLWTALGFVLLVCMLSLLVPGTLDHRIRYCGLALELSGIFVVILGLNEKLRLFNRPTLVGHAEKWLAGRPVFSPKSKAVALSGQSMAIAGGHATLSVWSNPVNSSVEARLDALENNIKTLKEQQSNIARKIDEQQIQWNQQFDAEREARKTDIKDLRALIEQFGIGGFKIEAVGVFWLILGATLATMSPEISTGIKIILGV